LNELITKPQRLPADLPQATHYHRQRRKRRLMKCLAEITRIASDLNERVAAAHDSVPDALVDHLSAATTSLSACRLILERRAGDDAA
jgi:hypothetical protein